MNDSIREVRDLRTGDEAYILNSARSAVKQVRVVKATQGLITVTHTDHRGQANFDFDRDTGEAWIVDDGDALPILLVPEDPTVIRLLAVKEHRRFRRDIESQANAVVRVPSPAEFDRLADMVEAWRDFAQGRTDLERQ